MKTFNRGKQLLIGGHALKMIGLSRETYLINNPEEAGAFLHDKESNIDYINANGHPFFAEIWEMEKNNIGEIATPQAMLELKSFAFVQHSINRFFQKADDAEYDIKFLARTFNLTSVSVVKKYITDGQLSEIEKIIASVRR